MKHRNVIMTVGIVLIVSLLGSCDALFTNVFKEAGLGQVSADTVKNADAPSLIATSGIESGTISQSFVDAVLSDDATKDEVLATLETEVTTTSDPAVLQASEALIVEITVQDSGADKVLDNMSNAISVVTKEDFDISDSSDLNSLIDAIVPEDMQTSGKLADAINALAGLDDNFTTLAGSVTGDQYSAQGLDAGTLAQTALVATTLSTLQPAVGYASIGEALTAAVNNPGTDITTYVTQASVDNLDDLTSDHSLNTLFSAAGFEGGLQGFIDSFKK